ncbi:MAG: transcription antitermination factor NusB [Candidatus Algichlamydia australiensis]|nr:transcription antitermination factor NusB [Chlamydiales bacterium]
MAITREKFREALFQALFALDHDPDGEVIPILMRQVKISKSAAREVQERAIEVLAKKEELDEKISSVSEGYSLERITQAERNIMRLGLFEILFDEEIPGPVSISEAIRLTRKFGSRDSAKFVNAILDKIYVSIS